jgi:hypothetical protein
METDDDEGNGRRSKVLQRDKSLQLSLIKGNILYTGREREMK